MSCNQLCLVDKSEWQALTTNQAWTTGSFWIGHMCVHKETARFNVIGNIFHFGYWQYLGRSTDTCSELPRMKSNWCSSPTKQWTLSNKNQRWLARYDCQWPQPVAGETRLVYDIQSLDIMFIIYGWCINQQCCVEKLTTELWWSSSAHHDDQDNHQRFTQDLITKELNQWCSTSSDHQWVESSYYDRHFHPRNSGSAVVSPAIHQSSPIHPPQIR